MLIGLLGQKRVGKDTSADYICNKYDFVKLSYAQPLKDICKILFDFTDEQLYGNAKEIMDQNWGISPRIIYQYIGTDVFRKDINKIIPDIGNNFWIKLMKIKCDEIPTQNKVIADIRYQNEIDQVHQLGGIVIKIVRSLTSDSHGFDEHESEKNIDELNGADYTIINNGTKLNLYKKIDDVMKMIESNYDNMIVDL